MEKVVGLGRAVKEGGRWLFGGGGERAVLGNYGVGEGRGEMPLSVVVAAGFEGPRPPTDCRDPPTRRS